MAEGELAIPADDNGGTVGSVLVQRALSTAGFPAAWSCSCGYNGSVEGGVGVGLVASRPSGSRRETTAAASPSASAVAAPVAPPPLQTLERVTGCLSAPRISRPAPAKDTEDGVSPLVGDVRLATGGREATSSPAAPVGIVAVVEVVSELCWCDCRP